MWFSSIVPVNLSLLIKKENNEIQFCIIFCWSRFDEIWQINNVKGLPIFNPTIIFSYFSKFVYYCYIMYFWVILWFLLNFIVFFGLYNIFCLYRFSSLRQLGNAQFEEGLCNWLASRPINWCFLFIEYKQ